MRHVESTHERLADRLANILTKLNMGYQLNAKELASEFAVSTRTISRDFDRLNAYLPLLQDEETKKYYLDSSYLGKITPKDIRSFAQLSGISHLYPSLDMSFLRELLDSRAHEVYSVKGYSFENAAKFKELFKNIGKSIQEHCQISFSYKGEVRSVEPYRLVHHHGSWYLAAVHNGKLKAYRLVYVESLNSLHESPTFKPDATILEQLDNAESIWFGLNKFEVVLTIDQTVASHFQQRQLLPEQQIIKQLDDGGLLLSSRITHNTQLLPLVRYWLPHIKIVNPEELQQELEAELKNYLYQ